MHWNGAGYIIGTGGPAVGPVWSNDRRVQIQYINLNIT